MTGVVCAFAIAYLPRDRTAARWGALGAVAVALLAIVVVRTSTLPKGPW